MSATLFRSNAARAALRAGGSKRAGIAGVSFTRGKATLPDLPYDYGALEPTISGTIMELHHSKHHNTYVTNLNNASEQMAEARSKEDITTQISLQPLINFNGGGHINHTLFWENLAPKAQGGGEPPSGKLAKDIDEAWGSFDAMKKQFNAMCAGIQGSGWCWLVQDTQTGKIGLKTYANQDPVVGQFRPILGVDAWEHSFYLQYQNRKAEYFAAIWDVMNWKAAEKRYQ